jgi:carbamoyltransferase
VASSIPRVRDVNVLGISAYFHDSAACVVRNGQIAAAVQEERLTRVRNDRRFPSAAIRACLELAGISADSIDFVAFYEKPYRKLERIAASTRHWYPRGLGVFEDAVGRWTRETLWLPGRVRQELARLSPSGGRRARWDGRLVYPAHHESHAASAFLPSPFDSAAILTMDGVGEWATTTLGVGSTDARGVPRTKMLEEIRFPHSLGLLYSAFTAFLGFAVNSDEYKVMGLAAYGEPRLEGMLREHVVDLRPDGSFALNMDLFSFGYSRTMFSERLADLLGVEPRRPDEPVSDSHADVAASLQRVTEAAVLGLARHARRETGERRLCMAGGVALNSVANGHLLRSGLFDELWIQPAAGDAGGALGAALHVWHDLLGERRPRALAPGGDGMEGALLGPAYGPAEIARALAAHGLAHQRLGEREIVERAADLLADGRVVAWFQGRMEFGPRALGGRSILADPRRPEMQDRLNAQIKFRESFRPFAAAVQAEHAGEWFDLAAPSPYMLLVVPVPSDALPACTHVDGSARIQTVDGRGSPRLAALIDAFAARTGVPVLVNTSFNLRGEPIVCAPDDAVRCFTRSGIDALVLEDFLVLREEQP